MAGRVIDATDETFMMDVVEASRRAPVVVDFWAPWCGPCQMLGPTLERVAAESDSVTLVKVNTDENPRVAQAFQIQSIPAVKAFKDGQVVSEFMGAQPEPVVRRFFEDLTPSQAEPLVEAGLAALDAGDAAGARQRFEAALQADPEHAGAAAALVSLLVGAGALDAAEELAQRFSSEPEVQGVLALLRFARGAAGADRAALEARVAADEGDVAAQYGLGCVYAASGEWEPAMERFLAVVQADRAYQDDAGRRALLEVFQVLGEEHPLTNEYRTRLMMLLF